jgi:uncharacterized protein YcbX
MICDVTHSPRVVSLRRYPVKSMTGEIVTSLDLDERGAVGDRVWSVRTTADKIGSGKNTSRFAKVEGLLEVRAAERDGRVVVTFPDGSSCYADDPDAAERLSRQVGQPVTFARETSVSHYDDGPVSLIGMASVATLSAERQADVDPLRFRPNIVLDTSGPFVEDTWVGQRLQIGSAVLRVDMTSPRCVMVDMETADLPEQHGNLKAIGDLNNACLGVIAKVITPGTITVGDELTVS